MRALLRSEWRKVTTTKMLWVLVGVAIVYSCVQAVTLTLVASGKLPGVPAEDGMLTKPDYIITLLAQTGTAATFVLILGIIAMTSEFRHMTITSTFLAAPRRWPVLLSKVLLYGALGAAIACITLIFVLIAATASLVPFEHAPITASAIGTVLVGAVIGLVLYAIVGVSIGSLIPNQVAAIVVALVWMLLVAIGLVLIVARIALQRSDAWLIRANLITLTGALYICSLVNFAAIIADYNVAHSREASGKGVMIDMHYLSLLGPQALPALDRAFQLRAVDTSLVSHRNSLVEMLRRDAASWRAWSFRSWRMQRYMAAQDKQQTTTGGAQ